MEVKEITNKEEWEGFVGAVHPTSVLQSAHWPKLLESENASARCFFVYNRDEVVAASLIAQIFLPLGKFYLYSPRGPVFKNHLPAELKEEAVQALVSFIKRSYAGPIFYRLDPAFNANDFNVYKLGFRRANKDVQPANTLIVDLTEDHEKVLAQMRPKTRYNIKVAEKRGVSVIQSRNEDDVRAFYKLLKNTGGRNNFSPHLGEHYLNLWRVLAPGNLKIYLAEHNRNFVAGIMVVFYGDTAVYLHGASSYEHRALMAPYLLHWQAIQDAKRNGFKFYDFWGVAPKEAGDSHPWAGISRFKLGFGGRYYEYFGTQDFVFNKFWYQVFNIARSVNRLVHKLVKN